MIILHQSIGREGKFIFNPINEEKQLISIQQQIAEEAMEMDKPSETDS